MFFEDSFLIHLQKERRLSSHTLLAYTNDLHQFLEYCKTIYSLTSVSEVRHLHIRAWVVTLMENGQSPRSVNRRLSCLKTYFHYNQKQGHVEQNPMLKVIGPKTAKRLPVVVRESEMRHLFEHIEFPSGYVGALHRIILETLYATGLRRGELARLRVNDIDFSRSVIRVAGKGGKMRLAPIPSFLHQLLQHFIELRRQSFSEAGAELLLSAKGRPFSPESVYAVVKKYLTLVSSAEQRSPHVLRHSFATHLSDHGADLNAIRELLGHSNLAATQIYMHNSIEKLKATYRQAHPKGDDPEQESTDDL